MDINLTYKEPLSFSRQPRTEDKAWDNVLAAYKNKDYKGVIHGIIDYVDLDLAARSGNADRSTFDVPHGSTLVQLHITDDRLNVVAPFLNIEESKKIPLMRKVTELNFSPLNLSAIHLQDNQLSFRYNCPLSLCEPYRTYDALREICVYADSYDDEFISKFDAKWVNPPRIEHFSDTVKETAWLDTQKFIEEASEGISHFESKRSFNLAWDVIVITVMKIEEYIHPQGKLRTDLEKMISYLTSSQDPMNEKVNRGKGFLDKLAKRSRADFDKDLYTVETFIPYKIRSSIQTVQANSENALAQSKKEIEQGNHLGATLTLQFHFLNMFFHNSMPNSVSDIVHKGLLAASGKPWQEASKPLYGALQKIMALKHDETQTKRKGFFSKLFGKKS